MPTSAEWYEPHHIILLKYWGTVTIDDIVYATGFTIPMMDETEETVHNLVDLTGIDTLAFSIKALIENEPLRRASTHPHLGWVLYYDRHNPLYNMYTAILSQA